MWRGRVRGGWGREGGEEEWGEIYDLQQNNCIRRLITAFISKNYHLMILQIAIGCCVYISFSIFIE